MIRKLITLVAIAVFAGGCMSASAATSPPAQHVRPLCVTVTFGWKTASGTEADAPVQMCGTGLRRGLICQLSTPGIAPGSVADCYAPKMNA